MQEQLKKGLEQVALAMSNPVVLGFIGGMVVAKFLTIG